MNIRDEKSRMERKKEETKKRIIEAAMKLFKKQGLDGTTMEQIAREADIAKGTLYNHFPVKEAIIDGYFNNSFSERYPERISQLRKIPDTRSRMILLLKELVAGVQSQKDFFEKYMVYRMRSMISFHRDEGVHNGLNLLINEIILLGRKNGEIRADLPRSVLEDLFGFIFIEVVKRFYTDPANFKASEVIAQYTDIFINGVRRRDRCESQTNL